MKQEIKPNAVYTAKEAADLLGVDKRSIYRLGVEGRLSIIKIGKGFKVLGENLIKFMKGESK